MVKKRSSKKEIDNFLNRINSSHALVDLVMYADDIMPYVKLGEAPTRRDIPVKSPNDFSYFYESLENRIYEVVESERTKKPTVDHVGEFLLDFWKGYAESAFMIPTFLRKSINLFLYDDRKIKGPWNLGYSLAPWFSSWSILDIYGRLFNANSNIGMAAFALQATTNAASLGYEIGRGIYKGIHSIADKKRKERLVQEKIKKLYDQI